MQRGIIIGCRIVRRRRVCGSARHCIDNVMNSNSIPVPFSQRQWLINRVQSRALSSLVRHFLNEIHSVSEYKSRGVSEER